MEVTPTGVRGDELTQRKVVRLDRSHPLQPDFYWKNSREQQWLDGFFSAQS